MSTKKITRWISNLKEPLKENYFEYVENVLKKPKESDLEFNRKEITPLEDTLRYIVENTHPSEKSFPTIDFYSLQAAFTLDPKAGAKPPTLSETESKTINKEKDESTDNHQKRERSRSKSPVPEGGGGSGTEDKKHKTKRRKIEIVDDEANASDSDDEAKKVERNKQMLANKRKLLKAIEAIIKVKWAKSMKPAVENFKQMGFENGNPFAVPLVPGCGWVPEEYFEKIKQPIDLLTIKENVESFHTNDLESFEADVWRVISNSKQWSKHVDDSLRVLRIAQEKNIQKNLAELRKEWGVEE
eukprot:CAMPEP_0204831750 /NCGR_PEP_ID=MMETSP1346-20131115/11504_1 /ASSEMBLY_ACC=CAM_ASM_000771 /TAXON_ID=215587 /ORGANISM="Aplanochytrium stocchinoi, Strain GSBS06" /LENGTH=299 /DNA_ID=CAMNT_0051963029 /DNA_START=194 /DNA_END=1093 /DNA_ORIENTATION=+